PGCRAPVAPAKAKLRVKAVAPPATDQLKWKWAAGADTPRTALGDPTTTTDYAICVYDTPGGSTALRLRAVAPAGGMCGSRACWKSTSAGFTYANSDATPEGLTKLTLKSGTAGKASISLAGKGTNLPAGALPIQATPSATVEIHNSAGECWGATFSAP